MSNKQDRQGVRTPADVERKYLLTLEKSFAEVLGIATDARQYAVETSERLSNEVARLDVAITEMEDKIVLLVADTYATNESVESKITLAKGEILSSVEGKYETKTNVATLKQTVNSQGAKIESQAKSIDANSSSLSSLAQEVDAQGASITQQATYITNNTDNIATIQSTVDEQGSKIGLIVDNNGIKAGMLIEAINGCTTATLSASKINFETDQFVINDTSGRLLFSAGKNNVTIGKWKIQHNRFEYYESPNLRTYIDPVEVEVSEAQIPYRAYWREICAVTRRIYENRKKMCEILGIDYWKDEWGEL